MKIKNIENILLKNGNLKFNDIYENSSKKIILGILSFINLYIIFSIIFMRNDNQYKNSYNYSKTLRFFKTDFEYHMFQREFISSKIKKYAKFQQEKNEPYFINGIIRKLKPKKCLEIGVAYGGSAILILNALKEIKDSFLISLDLNKKYYGRGKANTGYRVKKYFPELAKNWKLFTGKQPHKFLEKLKIKFDLLFLDTVHLAPGELINIIEALPFLNENAIVILHDIMYHLPSNKYNYKKTKFHPSQIYLMTSLYGNKIIIKDKYKGVENIGAVFLYPNQKNYYLNYFLLLLTPWEYLPNQKQIDELKIFIQKFYKEKIYIDLFNRAFEENKIYINKFKKF